MIVGTAHSPDAVNLWWTLWFLQAIWTSYQMRKIAGCVCAGNAGNVFPRRWFKRKLLVSDHGMHHGTCVTHVPWCMSGSLTCGDGKTFPAFPAHAHPQFCVSGKRPICRIRMKLIIIHAPLLSLNIFTFYIFHIRVVHYLQSGYFLALRILWYELETKLVKTNSGTASNSNLG